MNEKLRQVLLRQSETREALNTAASASEPDEAKLTDLRGKAQAIEVELRTALTEPDPEPEVDPEGTAPLDAAAREQREIRSRALLSTYVRRAIDGQPFDGAEAEFAAACGVGGNELPIDMIAPTHEVREREFRAVTPGPAAPQGTPAPIPYVFARTAAASLGVTFPSVDSGVRYFPVLTTAPPAGPKAEGVAATATAAAFALNTRTPKRITGQFELSIEDLAVLPSIEDSLGMAIGEAVSDSTDSQVMDGDNQSPNLDGLFRQATDVAVDGAKETFETGVARFAALVDGRYAHSMADLRAVIGTNTYALYAALFNNNGDVSLYDYLAMKMGSMFVSTHVPALASDGQKGIVLRQRGSQIAEVPVWRGLTLVRDPYTNAGKGQITVTAQALVGNPHLPYGTSSAVEIHPKLA